MKTKKPKRKSDSKRSVSVRMYCQGLGDCFLLSFPLANEVKRRVYVMIDFGVIIGTPIASQKMGQVIDDIARTVKATNGKPEIDLLIVTHEHWDHVSGFIQVPDRFEKAKAVTFKDVWLAWTEQPGHPLAEQIRREQDLKVRKLRASLSSVMTNLGAARTGLAEEEDTELQGPIDAAEAALQILDFFGPAVPDGNTPEAKSARKNTLAAVGLPATTSVQGATTAAAMAWLTSKATRYFKPGEQVDLPGAEGVRLFVLGPPEDLKMLRRDAPRKGRDEAYEADPLSLTAAVEWLGESDGNANAKMPKSPFDDRYGISPGDARSDPFFREFYGFSDDPLGDAGASWRRIEYEWVTGAAQLALKMDSDTNNTSLAIAFELPDGRTLIFPGDAQIGNWQSWANVQFPSEGSGKSISSRDLLQKAVLYKVGHHGSHNATLKIGGLEEMTGGDLVAMIPVDAAMASSKRPPNTGWRMPWEPLGHRLSELTKHRVLRADQDEKSLDALENEAGPSADRAWETFRDQVSYSKDLLVRDPKLENGAPDQPLFVEYSILL